MNLRWIVPFAFALLGCHASGEARMPALPVGVEWPTPEGFRREAIAFPLDFAPTLPYRGTEEIRFMPKFFDAKADGYWSYAFAWIMGAREALDVPALSRDLVTYFRGLSSEVGGKRFREGDARYRATLRVAGDEIVGSIDSYDPFTTGRELTLNIKVQQRACAASGLWVVLVAVSPRPEGDATWRALEDARGAFRCR